MSIIGTTVDFRRFPFYTVRMGSSALQTVDSKPVGYVFGRPTSYKPEYCQLVLDYFSAPREPQRMPVSAEQSEANGWKEQYRHVCGELPSLTGFAESVEVNRTTLLDWRRRHPDFDIACARGTAIAERLLAERSLNNLYNSQFAFAYAKNVFGWKDKTEVETVSSADTHDMAGMRQSLASATPEQLAQFSALLCQMQARAKIAPAEDAE